MVYYDLLFTCGPMWNVLSQRDYWVELYGIKIFKYQI